MLHAQIVCSRSLDHKLVDYELVRQSVCAFAERAAEKLREEKQYCRLVTLWLQSSHFSHHESHYYLSVRSPSPDLSHTRYAQYCSGAVTLFDRLWFPNVKYSKSGELMQTIDQINRGKGAIWFAGQDIQAQLALWKMKLQFCRLVGQPGYLIFPAFAANYSVVSG
ncbi:TPA: DUF4113 domain-containing protein [Providencia rettgeri]